MKTKNLSFAGILTVGIVAALIIVTSSCGGNSQQDGESSVRPPAVDFQTAAITGNIEAINQHIAAGSDLNERDPFGGSSPLITAIVFGQTEAAKVLIEAGADLNIQNNDGSTALHCAAFFCDPEIVRILVAKGVDKSVRNNFGSTARETVLGSWEDVKPIYDMQMAQMGPLGLKLDYEHLEKTRSVIANLLKE